MSIKTIRSTLLALLFLCSFTALAQQQRHIEYPTYFAHSNGISIAYQEFGERDAPAILLVMGLSAQLIHWDDDFVFSLVNQGYRVIRFDNRDAGLSEKIIDGGSLGVYPFIKYKLGFDDLGAPYLLDDMAADAIGLLDHLGIEKAHVAGVSMGGMIGQVLAAKYPERILSLASIMSTSGAEHLPEGSADVTSVDMDELEREERFSAMVGFLKVIEAAESSAFSDAQWRAKVERSYTRDHNPNGMGRQLWAIVDSGDRVELLKTIKAPTVVIHGKRDPLIPIVHGEHTASLVPNAEFLAIDNMGHYMVPDNHGPVISATLKNIARVTSNN